MSAGALVVSIHDVSPITREAVARIVAKMVEVGVGKTSLLVVPDHHRRGNILADGEFGPWLAGLSSTGHEAVLHGYYHRRERAAGESARTRFFTRIYTADEGEFFDISRERASELMRRGREELMRCAGVEPCGFIAPAWLLSAEAETAAREVGFDYTTRLKTVTNLRTGAVVESQSLCWSVRSGWRRAVSVGWNYRLFALLRAAPLLRVSIHPPDILYPKIWDQIERLTGEAAKSREVMTYAEYIARNG